MKRTSIIILVFMFLHLDTNEILCHSSDSLSHNYIQIYGGIALLRSTITDYVYVLNQNNYDTDYNRSMIWGNQEPTKSGTHVHFGIEYSFLKFLAVGFELASLGRITGQGASVEGFRYEYLNKNNTHSAVRESDNSKNYLGYIAYLPFTNFPLKKFVMKCGLGAGIHDMEITFAGYDAYSLNVSESITYHRKAFGFFGFVACDYLIMDVFTIGLYVQYLSLPLQHFDNIKLVSHMTEDFNSHQIIPVYAELASHHVNFSEVNIGLRIGFRTELF